MQLSNYPPGETGQRSALEQVKHHCHNEHEWLSWMYVELGVWVYYGADDEDACPECGQEGVADDR